MFTLQLVHGVNNSCLPYPSKQLLREKKKNRELKEKDKTTTGIWRYVNDYHFQAMKTN